MDLEFHQLELRYQTLRTRDLRRERRLLSSLAARGQQLPVVVIASSPLDAAPGGAPARYVLLDGYKRVRALRLLGADTVRATCWTLDEADALLLERLMRTSSVEHPLEQAWLLRELRDRFHLSVGDLARRFDKTPSWVSRRLGLVTELPDSIQQRVRTGDIGAHVAMKYLLPLARANRAAAEQLAAALPAHLPSRTAAALYLAYLKGSEQTRAALRANPSLWVRAYEESLRPSPIDPPSPSPLRADFAALVAIARRIAQRFGQGLAQAVAPAERAEFVRLHEQALRELHLVAAHLDPEELHA